MRRIIYILLILTILVSSLPAAVIAEETSSGRQILEFLQQDSSSAGAAWEGYTVTPASPIIFGNLYLSGRKVFDG